MNPITKVQPHHLSRHAYLYIRQSSMRQVIENTESTKRQYALRTRATALGWSDEQIKVIDCDQGESGASAEWREGFRRLVAEVGTGNAGIVMGLEVSRLARNNADWHRLLEICALTETLILDEEGVYDPNQFNDRLLLGLKGTMSEAELHVLKARLRGGVLNAVKRGEYRCSLPTGLVYDEAGEVVLDPDLQVRETIAYFFETFARVGSAHQTVKVFRAEGIHFPSRNRRGGGSIIVFRPLTESAAVRTLHNPRYAGAYAYGRRTYRKTADGKKVQQKQNTSDWLACIPDAHDGYITWERYEQNLAILQSNGSDYDKARQSPPREGPALLQGCAVCGRCGKHFRVTYRSARGRNESWYVCDRDGTGRPSCQTIAGGPIDAAVGALVAQMMTPTAVELALEVQREVEARREEVDLLRRQAIERAQIDSDLAKRRFLQVDPVNRLVAATLEADWNDKLRVLAEAREDRERYIEKERVTFDQVVRERLLTMTSDFQQLWADPATPNRERKRLLSFLVEDVTLVKLPDEGITNIHVRFKGDRSETLTATNPKSSAQQVKTPAETVALVDELLDDYTYAEIAEILNERGLRPGGSARAGRENDRYSAKTVAYLVRTRGMVRRYDRLRERGMLTKTELADRLGIHPHTLVRWAEHGILTRHAYNDHSWLYEDPGANPPVKHSSRWDKLTNRATATKSQGMILDQEEV